MAALSLGLDPCWVGGEMADFSHNNSFPPWIQSKDNYRQFADSYRLDVIIQSKRGSLYEPRPLARAVTSILDIILFFVLIKVG